MARVLVIISALFIVNSTVAENSISLLINPQYYSYSSDTLFTVADEIIAKPKATSGQIVEFTGAYPDKLLDVSYLFSLRNKLSSDSASDTIFEANEFYLTKNLHEWELTLGRRISSWGVGYGFRPLDVVQQYDQQTISLQSPIGKDMIALEYFSGMSSWSLLWVNSRGSDESENQKSAALVSKYSTSQENYDLHLVFRYNDNNKLQLGVGAINILSDEIAIHSSLFLSQSYQKQIHQLTGQDVFLLAEQYPYEAADYNNGLQALIGINWSSLSKHSIIAEYWYNEFAYTEQQWRELFDLAKQQQNLLAQPAIPVAFIQGNIAWTANATRTQTLTQHNVMLQWSYDADYWKPVVNIQFSPVDNSSMITLSSTVSSALFKFEIGMRTFLGAKDSVYGGLVISNILFMTLSGEY